ncbi:MAG: SRPBCC family protein [Hyphomonadaceae bacterium]
MIEHTEILSGDSIRIERVLAAPPQRIWDYIVDPEKRARWFCGGDAMRDTGQRFAFAFNHTRITPEPEPNAPPREPGAPDFVSYGEVLEFMPPRLLKFMWEQKANARSEVMFELTPEGDGTRVVITHTRLPSRGDVLSVGGGWNAHLDMLADELAARTHGPFWSQYAAYKATLEPKLPQ